jgi:hypothetical protein
MAGMGARAAAKFLVYYEEAKRLHLERAGAPLKEYKPTEPDRLAAVFDGILRGPQTGLDFLGNLLHRIVWAQCLGNANHRTAILFVQAFLDSAGLRLPYYADEPNAPARFHGSVDRFTDLSHRLLDRQSEFGFGPEQLETQHRDWSRRWVAEELGNQSRVAMTMGPQRLRTFLS